jgi:hypothetical protein
MHKEMKFETLPDRKTPHPNKGHSTTPYPTQAPHLDNGGHAISSVKPDNGSLITEHRRTNRGPAAHAVDVSRALTDMELRVSCYSNQIDLHATVRQQQVLAELARIERELDSMPAPNAQQDEISFLRMQNALLNQKCAIMDLLMGG